MPDKESAETLATTINHILDRQPELLKLRVTRSRTEFALSWQFPGRETQVMSGSFKTSTSVNDIRKKLESDYADRYIISLISQDPSGDRYFQMIKKD